MDPGGLLPHRMCVSACEQDNECPSDLKCIALPQGRKVCANALRAACLGSGCDAGKTCIVTMPLLAHLQAECVKVCLPKDPTNCEADEFCMETSYGGTTSAICEKTCIIGGPPCPSGKACIDTGVGPTVCRPVLSRNENTIQTPK